MDREESQLSVSRICSSLELKSPVELLPLMRSTTVEGISLRMFPTSKKTSTRFRITESTILDTKSRFAPESNVSLDSGEPPRPKEPKTATEVGIDSA